MNRKSFNSLIQNENGYTLIELVMAMVISAIVLTMAVVLFNKPFETYNLVRVLSKFSNDSILFSNRFRDDSKQIVFGSVRISNSGGSCVEFMPEKLKIRYATQGQGAMDFMNAGIKFNAIVDNSQFTSPDKRIKYGDYIAIHKAGSNKSELYIDLSNYYSAISKVTSVNSFTQLNSGVFSHFITIVSHQLKQFPVESPDESFSVIPGDSPIIGYTCLNAGVDGDGTGTGTVVRYTQSLPRNSTSTCSTAVASPLTTETLLKNVASCSFVMNSINPNLVDFSATLQKNSVESNVFTSFKTSQPWQANACVTNGCEFQKESDNPYCVANCGSTESCTLHGCPAGGSFTNDAFCVANCGGQTCATQNCPPSGSFTTNAFCATNCGGETCATQNCPSSGSFTTNAFCATNCGGETCATQNCPSSGSFTTNAFCVTNCGGETCATQNCPSSGSFTTNAFCVANCGAESCASKQCPNAGESSSDSFCQTNCGAIDPCTYQQCPSSVNYSDYQNYQSSNSTLFSKLSTCINLQCTSVTSVPPPLPDCYY